MKRVCLYETPPNNHGCRGFELVVEPTSSTEGVVVDGYACSSCWQVGHDDANAWPRPLGATVRLPDGWIWETAAEPAWRSHNELVDDRDEPQPDCSALSPYSLEVIA